MARVKHEHYVNNKEFTAAVTKWVLEYRSAKEKGEEPPPIPYEIADSFYKIARRYSSKPNFSGYTYKEDMIGEALYTCIRYAHNFDPEKSNNAFAYFTQYCHNAFIQFINKEKKFADLKFDLLKDADPKIATHDYKDINLFYEDEDNQGIADLEMQEEEIIKTQFTPIEKLLKDEL